MKKWEANPHTGDFKPYARQCSWFGWKKWCAHKVHIFNVKRV